MKANSRNIFVVRHLHPQIPDGICLGKKNVPLSSEGREEGKILADYLLNKNINNVYSSPLIRARETASIICDKKLNIRENFAELNMGIWDGLSFDEIKKKFPKEYIERGNDFENYIIEGGESLSMCKKRAMSELDTIIRETDGNILVVTHAGVIRTIVSSIAKTRMTDTFEYKIDYGSITLLSIDDNKLNLIKIGDLEYKNNIRED